MSKFKIENLDAIGRAHDRIAAMRKDGDKVIPRAIGTLKRKLPTWMKRDIATQYALPVNKIGKRLRVTSDESSLTLTGLGRMQRLTNFPCRQNSRGLAVQIEKGKPVQIPHGFLRVPTGSAAASGMQAFVRQAVEDLPEKVYSIAEVAKDKHGYPVSMLGGPSVGMMMVDGDRFDRAADYGRELFAQEIDRLVEAGHGQ
ncbi:MAG: hypothetical protein QM741_13190 [Rudaea sp.]|uniref:hypothetical protein n=1 Tax=Rudaea sp. TaxID=2136325 RepID=UPI0039E6E259